MHQTWIKERLCVEWMPITEFDNIAKPTMRQNFYRFLRHHGLAELTRRTRAESSGKTLCKN